MKTPLALFVFSLGITYCFAAGPPTAGRGPESKIFDVRVFGAKGDGTSLDTKAIQEALDACGQAGGGVVKFPAGTYLSQPLTIRTETTVQLEAGATLLASTNQSNFMKVPGDWLQVKSGSAFIPFISGKGLTDVTFAGQGAIDGNGNKPKKRARKGRGTPCPARI